MAEVRKSLYVESTIPSYIRGRTSRDIIIAGRQAAARLFWETKRQDFDLFVSDYVLDEITRGDPLAARERQDCIADITILKKNDEIDKLALIYKSLLGIPNRAQTDCNHLATCVIEGIDYLLTWNCSHLGPEAQMKIQEYNENNGLWVPALVTPEVFLPDVKLEDEI
jgi:hypothetical protein